MSDSHPGPTRRSFLATTGRLAAASALAGTAMAHVHPGGSDTIRVALVGCGGRGGGAATNALAVPGASIELVAAADVFAGKPAAVVDALQEQFAAKVNVPPERQFVGFDGYRKAMDCLRPGDIVILTTPPAFRWVHYAYAIEKGWCATAMAGSSTPAPSRCAATSCRRARPARSSARRASRRWGKGARCWRGATVQPGYMGDTLVRAHG
jgi:hypothetical protein